MREPTTNETTDALTTAALAESPRDGLNYQSGVPLGNPLADVCHGQSQNWDKHLLPTNTVGFIRSCENPAVGVAMAAESAIEALVEYSPEIEGITHDGVIGVYKTLAGRFGVGALGETFAAGQIEGEVEEPRPGDEKAGIDLRVGGKTYQVKTAENRRSDWSKKDADHLIWVEVKEGGWEVHKME